MHVSFSLLGRATCLTVGTPPHGPSPQAEVYSLYTAAETRKSVSQHGPYPEAGSRQREVSPPPPFRLSSNMDNGPNATELHQHLVHRHRLREDVGGAPPLNTERACLP